MDERTPAMDERTPETTPENGQQPAPKHEVRPATDRPAVRQGDLADDETTPVESAGAANGTRQPARTPADEPDGLFSDDEASRYRDDWHTVQASFVDDPQAAVGKAEALVEHVVDAVTSKIAQRRAELSGRRTSTEGERTEQLRQALRGYRALLLELLPGEQSPNRTVPERDKAGSAAGTPAAGGPAAGTPAGQVAGPRTVRS